MTFRQKLGKLVIPMLLCYWSNINMIKNQESKEIPCFAKWATGTCPALTCCHSTTLLSPRVHLADLQHVAHVLLCHDLLAPINKVLRAFRGPEGRPYWCVGCPLPRRADLRSRWIANVWMCKEVVQGTVGT